MGWLGMAHKRADPFYYSPEWRALRRLALKRDRYRCVVCGRGVAGKGEARIDHVKTRRERPDLELVLSNVRTLCADHDNQAHREKGRGGGPRDQRFVIRGCDADGWPLARQGEG
jgi:5-methylcytosine-specific restriction enzyme A